MCEFIERCRLRSACRRIIHIKVQRSTQEDCFHQMSRFMRTHGRLHGVTQLTCTSVQERTRCYAFIVIAMYYTQRRKSLIPRILINENVLSFMQVAPKIGSPISCVFLEVIAPNWSHKKVMFQIHVMHLIEAAKNSQRFAIFV